jgi:hypothetical protein
MNTQYNGAAGAEAVAHVDGGSAPAAFAGDKTMSSSNGAINAGPPSADLLVAVEAESNSSTPGADSGAIDGGAAPAA